MDAELEGDESRAQGRPSAPGSSGSSRRSEPPAGTGPAGERDGPGALEAGLPDGSAPDPGPAPSSVGNISEHHWSRARAGANREAIEYMQGRSRAPGVESGGAERNHYCMECQGVIPLSYDSRVPLDEQVPERCPHCGALLEGRVRAMFNWVEIDQVSGSDARALLPLFLGLLLALVLLALLVRALLSGG